MLMPACIPYDDKHDPGEQAVLVGSTNWSIEEKRDDEGTPVGPIEWVHFYDVDQAHVVAVLKLSAGEKKAGRAKLAADASAIIEKHERAVALEVDGIAWVEAIAAETYAAIEPKAEAFVAAERAYAALPDGSAKDLVADSIKKLNQSSWTLEVQGIEAAGARDAAAAHRALAEERIAEAQVRIEEARAIVDSIG